MRGKEAKKGQKKFLEAKHILPNKHYITEKKIKEEMKKIKRDLDTNDKEKMINQNL